jgi:hypothetical protein
MVGKRKSWGEVGKRKSWGEATIISRLDSNHWRAEYPGGVSGMFREADIRAYDAERDARLRGESCGAACER